MSSKNRQLCVRLGKGLMLFVMMAFFFQPAWVPIAVSSEVVLPMKENVLMQTNGPDSEFDDGDYWTHRDHGNAAHQFVVEVPPGLNPDFVARIQLWDPESYSTSEQSLTDTDEQKGNGWEATTFTLYSPTNAPIAQSVYAGGDVTSNQQWVHFFDLRLGDHGPGQYLLQVRVDGDDQNGYKIGIENGDADNNAANGNEIKLFAKRTAFQYIGQGELCNTFYFKVANLQSLHLFNFDLDNAGVSVTYFSPSGVEYPGTASGNALWNTDPPAPDLPAIGGDVIQNPESGWWRAVICVTHPTPYADNGNQFIFWPNDLLFNGPYQPGGEIGDWVWIDENQNGLQDNGEEGLPNVTVRLLDGITDTPIRSTTTDVAGHYSFDDVGAGTYRIEWILPQYFFFTAPRVGQDQNVDSDADPNTGLTGAFYFPGNISRMNLDAGMIPKKVSNLRVLKTVADSDLTLRPGDETTFVITVTNQGPDDVTNVRIYDLLPEGIEYLSATRHQDYGPNPLIWVEALLPAGESRTYEVQVRIGTILGELENCAWVTGPNKDPDLTDNNSCVIITVQPEGPGDNDINIGDRVWLDADEDGVQDPGEAGVPGVTVNLLSGVDETLISSDVTDADGLYLFIDRPAGSYKIGFVLPGGYAFTAKNQGGDPALDSDANQVTGITDAFTTVLHNDYLTWDAGLVPYEPPPDSHILIGDYVWNDLDGDGQQDLEEPGIANVQVMLLTGGDQTILASTYTDVNGAYKFENVPPGSYRVAFVLLPGYHFTVMDATDDAHDSDADPGTGRTIAFNVVSNTEYRMWDAGMVENSESDLEIEKVIEENRSYIYRGDSLTFIITVTNHGPDVAHNVTVIDNLPAGLEFLSADRAQDEGPNPLIWHEPMMPVGGTITYRILMRTTLELGGIDNCVTVSSTSFDPDLSNNIACAQVHILVPVELSSFSAKSAQGRVQLNWVTQSETENMGFHILRSELQDGVYTRINKDLIQGYGTTSSVHAYQYLDDSDLAPAKTYYYKLVDMDYKGRLNTHGPVTAVVELPTEHVLDQNYPNPFNPETRISFTLKDAGEVALTVYNVRGEIVRSLVSGRLNAGAHMKVWDGKDNSGMTVPSGMYIYTLRINNFEQKRSMMFLK